MPTGYATPDPLTSSIKSLQETITRYGRNIGADEIRTRDDLVKPLLNALGWNSPSVITPEYIVTFRPPPFRNTRVDYALHQPDKPGALKAFIEAKRMGRDLTEEHRKQLFKYAKDRAVSSLVLTNGDRWELYEPVNRIYRRIFGLSISKDSAADCARKLRDHFPKAPVVEATASANHSQVPALAPPNATSVSRTPETDAIPPSGWASRVDVPKVLTWLVISFIALGILGWIIGLSIDQPISNVFAAIGLVVMLGLLIIAVIVFRRSLPSAVPRAIGALRRQLFAPINGDRRETWTSVAVAISCGSAFGSLSGYILGYSMADFITEFLITLVIVGITGILVSFLISLPFLYCLELFLGKKKRDR